MTRFCFLLLAMLFVFGCGNNASQPYSDVDMGDYVIAPLTTSLIDELGGTKALMNYQVYISSPLVLSSLKTSSQNKSVNDGSVQMVHDKYIVEFSPETPGIIKEYKYKEDDLNPWMSNLNIIDVYFDEREDSYLSFFREYHGSHPYYDLFPGGYTVRYESEEWKPDKNVYLVLHLDKEVYERLHSKKAKGRIIETMQ